MTCQDPVDRLLEEYRARVAAIDAKYQQECREREDRAFWQLIFTFIVTGLLLAVFFFCGDA